MNISLLKELVEKGTFSKVEIAEKCGFSRTTLDNILSGADVKVSTVESLAAFFDIPVGHLFGDKMIAPTDNSLLKDLENAKKEIDRLNQIANSLPVKSTKVIVELDVTDDEFIKLGLKEKVLQILNKK